MMLRRSPEAPGRRFEACASGRLRISEPAGAMEGEESAPAAAALPPVEGAGRAQLARRAGVVSAAVPPSRVRGLVREQVFAIFFGAGRELDAFITAFRIPNLFRDLFAEGALSAAFVTTFTHRLEHDGEASAWRLASLVVNVLALVVGLLTLLGIWLAPALVYLIAAVLGPGPGRPPGDAAHGAGDHRRGGGAGERLREQQLRLLPRKRPGLVAERRLPLHAAPDRALRRGDRHRHAPRRIAARRTRR